MVNAPAASVTAKRSGGTWTVAFSTGRPERRSTRPTTGAGAAGCTVIAVARLSPLMCAVTVAPVSASTRVGGV